MRTAGDPLPMLNTVRREIWAVDRNVALTFNGHAARLPEAVLVRRAALHPDSAGHFAGVGLALVALGVYSVIAYTVSRQTHEIGIRMALGAARRDVLKMVLRMGLRLSAIGIVLGLIATSAVARTIASQIWGVSPHDPATLSEWWGGRCRPRRLLLPRPPCHPRRPDGGVALRVRHAGGVNQSPHDVGSAVTPTLTTIAAARVPPRTSTITAALSPLLEAST